MQCTGQTQNGMRCRNNAISGTTSCYIRAHGSSAQGFWKRLQNRVGNHQRMSSVLGVATLVALAIAVFQLALYFRDAKRNALAGILDSSTASYPPMFVSVGETRFTLAPSAQGVLFSDYGDPLLSFHVARAKMLASAVIRNPSGELIAELVDNEWTVNKSNIFDRNYTDEALEVRDAEGRIALQVVAFGQTVHIAAILRCRGGRTVVVGPNANGAIMQVVSPGQEPSYSIPRICDYPSNLHFGSCPGIEVLRAAAERSPHLGGILLTKPLDICR